MLSQTSDTCPQLIFATAEDVQSSTFRNWLKESSHQLHNSLELLVVDAGVDPD